MKAAFSIFTICLFSVAASAHSVLQQEHFDCSFNVGAGAPQVSAIDRTLSVERSKTFESTVFVPSPQLAATFSAAYARKLNYSTSIGGLSYSANGAPGATLLSPLSGTIISGRSSFYIGEVNSRFDVQNQITLFFSPKSTTESEVDFTLEDIASDAAAVAAFKQAYHDNFNLDVADSTFLPHKIHFAGTCRKK